MPAISTKVGGASTQKHQILARLSYTMGPFTGGKMVGGGFWQDVFSFSFFLTIYLLIYLGVSPASVSI